MKGNSLQERNVLGNVLIVDHHVINIFFLGGGGEGLGVECVKITLIISCLEWLTRSFFFIMVEFERVLYTAPT